MIKGPNAHDQIAFYGVHSFLVEVQMKLFTHSRCMQNSNLEIKIAGDNPCPFFLNLWHLPQNIKQKGTSKLKMSPSSLWTPHVTKVLVGPKNFSVARL